MLEAKKNGGLTPPNDASLASVLAKLDRRLDTIEQRLERIEDQMGKTREAMAPLPQVAATAVDTLDDIATRLQARGVDLDARLDLLLRLLEAGTNPTTLAIVERVLAHPEKLEEAVTMAESAPAIIATAVDTVDDVMARLASQGIDPANLTTHGIEAATRVMKLVQEPGFLRMLDSGLLDPEAIDVLTLLGRALKDARRAEIEPRGMFGMVGAMRDPDIQLGLGFALALAQRFGQLLRPSISS